MASRWRLGVVAFTVVASTALSACVSVPVRHTRPEPYGYGGSGYASNVNPSEAREQCLRVAREYRGYHRVRAGEVALTSPDTARVELLVRGPYGRRVLDCSYDARRDTAYVP